MLTRRRLLSAGLISVGAITLVACSQPAPVAPASSTAGTGAGAAPTSAPPASAPTTVAAAAATAPSTAQGGGTLVFARTDDSTDLDPATYRGRFNSMMIWQFFDTLWRYKVGSADEFEPALATSWEQAPDKMSWTFHLRQGVTFHDGTPFNADAVIFSFMRQIDPNHPNHTEKMVDFPTFLGMIKNVEKVDDATVKMNLAFDSPIFSRQIASAWSSIVSPTAADKLKRDFSASPVGTGPFSLDQWNRGSDLQLNPNPNYWGGKPPVDRLVIRVIPEPSVQLAELEAGNVHIMEAVQAPFLDRIRQNSQLKLITSPGMANLMIFFNFGVPQFSDIRVRQAFNYAIDRQKLVDTILGGTALVANGAFPPGVVGYDPTVGVYAYDPEKAKQLLAAAGLANGLETTLGIEATPNQYNIAGPALAQVIQANLNAVGITANVQQLDSAAFQAAGRKGDLPLGITGIISANSDPSQFLQGSFTTDGIVNYGKFGNKDLDSEILAAQQVLEAADRQTTYRNLHAKIMDLVPGVFLTYQNQLVATRANVKGYTVMPISVVRFDKASVGGAA
jgi:peptide/nickel transport system substrate-binding protein